MVAAVGTPNISTKPDASGRMTFAQALKTLPVNQFATDADEKLKRQSDQPLSRNDMASGALSTAAGVALAPVAVPLTVIGLRAAKFLGPKVLNPAAQVLTKAKPLVVPAAKAGAVAEAFNFSFAALDRVTEEPDETPSLAMAGLDYAASKHGYELPFAQSKTDDELQQQVLGGADSLIRMGLGIRYGGLAIKKVGGVAKKLIQKLRKPVEKLEDRQNIPDAPAQPSPVPKPRLRDAGQNGNGGELLAEKQTYLKAAAPAKLPDKIGDFTLNKNGVYVNDQAIAAKSAKTAPRAPIKKPTGYEANKAKAKVPTGPTGEVPSGYRPPPKHTAAKSWKA